MLTKIGERAANALLRQEFPCGEANFRTLAEAITSAIFISQGKRLQYVNHAASPMYSASIVELSIQPRDTVAMSLPSSCPKQRGRPQGLLHHVFVAG
jgi:hypothetical protein